MGFAFTIYNLHQLNVLAEEICKALLEKLSKHGGHFGPNFGMVEATIAMHYVFESPKDKIVYDVSHQSYPHKMLTGRKDAFLYEEHYDDVSGYSNPGESEHDHFTIGHTSTSVSLALGLAKARDLKEEDGNVIAVIGDGSLSGGEALEGLDYAAELGGNLIIVVNDNDMSIAENHGGLYENLKELRETNGEVKCNLFKAMGLDYIYVKEGNKVADLIEAFKQVKDTKKAVVVHINTQKGKGYKLAEEHKEDWHYCAPFDVETGKQFIDVGIAEETAMAMLDWSIDQDQYPVAIKLPGGEMISDGKEVTKDFSQLNKYEVTQKGSKVAVIGLGTFYNMGCEVAKAIEEKTGTKATVINPYYITGIDEALLEHLKKDHDVVITLEDGFLEGGFGEKIARFYGDSDVKVFNYGVKKELLDRYDVAELLEKNHLTVEQIVEDLSKF